MIATRAGPSRGRGHEPADRVRAYLGPAGDAGDRGGRATGLGPPLEHHFPSHHGEERLRLQDL